MLLIKPDRVLLRYIFNNSVKRSCLNLSICFSNATQKVNTEKECRNLTSIQANQNTAMRIWEFHGSSPQDRKSILYEATNEQKDNTSPTKPGKSSFEEIITWKKVHDKINSPSSDDASSVRERITQKAVHLFLPYGYPYTTSAGYADYATFCFCSSVAGSAAMVLSTQALLHAALGISLTNASALSAGINWVIKDGIGQLGGIIFASKIGQARGLDSNPKRWRMTSAICMDVSTFLEICTPLFPSYFLIIASVANVGKNIGFLSASASKAALHQSLQLDSSNNLADITAKAGSQAIFASLVGTTCGIGLSTLIGSDFKSVAMGFVVLSAIHEVCTYQALKAVQLRSLSKHRMHILLDHFVRQRSKSLPVVDSVLSPKDVTQHESFFPIVKQDDSYLWLKVGCGLQEICLDTKTYEEQLVFNDEKYVLSLVRCSNSPIGYQIRLAFIDGAVGKDLIRAALHGYYLRFMLLTEGCTSCDTFSLRSASYSQMAEVFEEFFEALQTKKWRTECEYVSIEGNLAYRISIEKPPSI